MRDYVKGAKPLQGNSNSMSKVDAEDLMIPAQPTQ